MEIKACVGLAEDGRRSDNLMHAAPPEAAAVGGDDVMVDLSCFRSGGHNSAAAAMEEADHQDLMENAAAIFSDDLIPPLPEFQCMSSYSSSSSSSAVKPVAYQSTASSSVSSSSSSWAVFRSDGEEQHNGTADYTSHHQPQQVAMSSTASMEMHPQSEQSNRLDEDDDIGCMDVMETLSFMDMLDESGPVWDYNNSPVLDCNEEEEAFQYNREAENPPQPPHAATAPATEYVLEKGDNSEGLDKSEDLAVVFFEWLKTNKESVSAEDLRSIKLKKSTIESAAKRLGNGKEGMKRLLQLILEWVQHHQLQRKRSREEEEAAMVAGQAGFPNQPYPVQYPTQPFQSPDAEFIHSNLQPDPSRFAGVMNPPPWSAGFDPSMAVGVPAAGAGYLGGGDPFGHFSNMVDHSPWPGAAPPICMNYNVNANSVQNLSPVAHHHHQQQQQQQAYSIGAAAAFNQYPYQYYPAVGNGNNENGAATEDGLVPTSSSATKEARKKRMARQRRFWSHHRHHPHHHNSSGHGHHHANNGHSKQMDMAVGSSPLSLVHMENNYANISQPPGGGNWAYWQNATAPSSSHIPALVPNVGKSVQGNEVSRSPLQQAQNYQRPIAPERCPGLKPENNLRFLLQKVLKQSDVGSLGRIVLPKKEAETHLPQLTARDGINIAMEDIGTSNVWNMRYRFWPNNKSRMYLLENTGDFVKSNELQEGDFIVIYSDIKCGKYMIRGVKVRQQGPKSENRRSGNVLKKNPSSSTSNDSPEVSPSPNTTLTKKRPQSQT